MACIIRASISEKILPIGSEFRYFPDSPTTLQRRSAVTSDTDFMGAPFFQPRSIVQLILVGFAVATLPLVFALVSAFVYVEKITATGERAVFDATIVMQASRALTEQLTGMERHAKQYNAVNDPAFYDVYKERRVEFQGIADTLRKYLNEGEGAAQIDDMLRQEERIHDAVRAAAPGSREIEAALAEFPELVSAARRTRVEAIGSVSAQIENIRQSAERARRIIFWMTAALIPAVIVLTALFITLITRPLRQIDHEIRQLGGGRFMSEIHVEGPMDLQELGQRLDWMRRRLVELENQKTLFLRHMSHELKTPLTSIREGSELLNERIAGPLTMDQQEIIAVLRENSLRLQKLVEDLLDFNAGGASLPIIADEVFRLDQVVEEVVADHGMSGKAKELHFHMDLDEITVNSDREKIRVVIDNLISNAIKYSPSHGIIRIGLKRDLNAVRIDVQDQGPGINPEDRERIFDAFYQGRASSTGHIHGSGLGLSLARLYVGLLEGRVQMVDQEYGAHFRVTLPCADPVV